MEEGEQWVGEEGKLGWGGRKEKGGKGESYDLRIHLRVVGRKGKWHFGGFEEEKRGRKWVKRRESGVLWTPISPPTYIWQCWGFDGVLTRRSLAFSVRPGFVDDATWIKLQEKYHPTNGHIVPCGIDWRRLGRVITLCPGTHASQV